MPLVRIDMQRQSDPSYPRQVGAAVYEAMRQTINVPDKDNFQILTEHDETHFVFDPSYLDIPRSSRLIYIQITLNEGRTLDQKRALYKTIVERLAPLDVRPEDVLINLVEVKRENWSFGNGVAQYANP